MNKHGFSTRAIHVGQNGDVDINSLAMPIYQSSTFIFDSVEDGAAKFAGEKSGFIYSRLGNPTVVLFERKMAALEGGESALAFASGMAAISAVIVSLAQFGDHIICSRGLYGCTYGLFKLLERKFGIKFTLVDMRNQEQLEKAFQENTKIVYIETPINPTMEIADLSLISRISKSHGAYVVVDNTFMSPYLQRPIEHGADFVIHSATKYIGGHGDVIAGVAIGPQSIMNEVRLTVQKDMGGILSPNDAFLLNRGLKTLAIRMDRHCQTALKVAQYLQQHHRVKMVHYPGLPGFEQYELAKRQMDGFGGIISFELDGGVGQVAKVLNQLQIIKLAVSLGDVDSLIQHPATMTHSGIPREKRLEMGVSDGLVRLSVGLEDVDDILVDLEQALQ